MSYNPVFSLSYNSLYSPFAKHPYLSQPATEALKPGLLIPIGNVSVKSHSKLPGFPEASKVL